MISHGVLNNGRLMPDVNGLPVVETEPPSPLEHGFKAVARYERQGDQIVKIWDVVPWTEQDWKNAEGEGDSNG